MVEQKSWTVSDFGASLSRVEPSWRQEAPQALDITGENARSDANGSVVQLCKKSHSTEGEDSLGG